MGYPCFWKHPFQVYDIFGLFGAGSMMPGVVDTEMQTHLRSQEPVAISASTVEGKSLPRWKYLRKKPHGLGIYWVPGTQMTQLFWLEFRPCFEGLTFKQKGHLGSRYIILKLCRYPLIAWIENGIYNIAFQCLPWLWKFKSQFARCVAARNKNPARTLRVTASSAVWAVSIVTMRNQLHHHQATRGFFVGSFLGGWLHY